MNRRRDTPSSLVFPWLFSLLFPALLSRTRNLTGGLCSSMAFHGMRGGFDDNRCARRFRRSWRFLGCGPSRRRGGGVRIPPDLQTDLQAKQAPDPNHHRAEQAAPGRPDVTFDLLIFHR
jgi:hypothetical protein